MKRQWTDEELETNFTLHPAELDLIGDSKTDRNLLGFAVLLKYFGRSEALFVFKMIGDHRFAGSQGKPCRRSKISPDSRNSDDPRIPSNPGTNEEAVFCRNIFENLTEFGAQSFCRHSRCVCQQLIEGGALERDYTQLRKYFLLPDTLLQSA